MVFKIKIGALPAFSLSFSFGTALLADSSITLAIKPWVKIADYVAAQAEINKAVVERFRDAGIEIPCPQREVRLVNAPPPEPGRRAA